MAKLFEVSGGIECVFNEEQPWIEAVSQSVEETFSFGDVACLPK
jgi:hypothetical protein